MLAGQRRQLDAVDRHYLRRGTQLTTPALPEPVDGPRLRFDRLRGALKRRLA